jgi:uncharacterized protein (TIRG00374 family)
VKVLLSLAVALIALALLFAWGGVDPGDVLATLAEADLRLVALAFVVQGLIYVFRAVRLRVLLRGAGGADVSIRGLTAASAAWILDSHVLPAKVGEASLVLHLSRVGVRAEHGLIGLVVSRLLDLSTLLFVLGVACSAMAVAGDHPQLPWLQSLGLFALAAASVLGVVILRGEHLVRAGRGIAVRVLPRTLGERSGRFLTRVEDALRVLPRRAVLTAALLSLPVWTCVLGVYAALGMGVGLEGLAAADLLFGASLAVLGSLVPINGFLGFGMLDMGWAWGFAAVGVPESHAVATGLAFHALYIVGVGILGAVGHAQLLSWKR